MNYKIVVSYFGKNYNGFQKQINLPTIQESLEIAISSVLKEEIKITGSGRTDAGVSAIEQVCNFETSKNIIEKSFVGHVNSILPKDIRILDFSMCEDNFNARFSAKKKTYTYLFYSNKTNIPYFDQFAVRINENFNIKKANEICKIIEGEHDFTCFCSSDSDMINKVRTIYYAKIDNVAKNLYKFEICGNGFLYNMVRIIVGTIIDYSTNKFKLEDVVKAMINKDRTSLGKTMNAKGLVLIGVEY